MSEKDKIHKLLIMGLDQAGKTSILNILNEKYNKMDNIKPTVGVERDHIKILGIPIVSWDLGGQEKFRKEYLKNIKIFDQTDSLFFVVDVVNVKRYEEALQYYSDALKMLENLETKPKIVLCVHKVDPNLQNDPEILKLVEELKQLFYSRSEGHTISVSVTSIYDRKSIIETFSKNLQELISTLKPFKKILKNVILLLQLDAAVLFDENLMILSDAYKTEKIEEVCLNTVYNSIYYMTHTNPTLADNFLKNFELVLNIKHNRKIFTFMEVKFKGWDLYLLTMSNEKVNSAAVFTKFQSMAHIFEEKKIL